MTPIDQQPFSGGPSSGPDMPQEKLLEQELEAYSEVETNQEPKKQPQTNPISMKDLPSPPRRRKICRRPSYASPRQNIRNSRSRFLCDYRYVIELFVVHASCCFLNLPFPTNSPFILVFTFNVLERHTDDNTRDQGRRSWDIHCFYICNFVYLLLLSCIWTISPASFSPCLVLTTSYLVSELHPILGFFIPITSFLRGLVLTASVRWLLNFAAFTMIAMGEGL